MFTANIVPGYGFQEVEIYIKRHGKTASGRVTEVGYQPAEQAFLGIAAEASQREKEEWRQNQHPITHTVVHRCKRSNQRFWTFHLRIFHV